VLCIRSDTTYVQSVYRQDVRDLSKQGSAHCPELALKQTLQRIQRGVRMRTCIGGPEREMLGVAMHDMCLQVKIPAKLEEQLKAGMKEAGIPIPDTEERWEQAMIALKVDPPCMHCLIFVVNEIYAFPHPRHRGALESDSDGSQGAIAFSPRSYGLGIPCLGFLTLPVCIMPWWCTPGLS